MSYLDYSDPLSFNFLHPKFVLNILLVSLERKHHWDDSINHVWVMCVHHRDDSINHVWVMCFEQCLLVKHKEGSIGIIRQLLVNNNVLYMSWVKSVFESDWNQNDCKNKTFLDKNQSIYVMQVKTIQHDMACYCFGKNLVFRITYVTHSSSIHHAFKGWTKGMISCSIMDVSS